MKKIVYILLFLLSFYKISLSANTKIAQNITAEDQKFVKVIEIVLKFEGGYFKEEHTNFGITQGTYNKYRNARHLKRNDVINITKNEVYEIYYNMYYFKSRASEMPIRMCLVHFDTAVNFGLIGAQKLLSKTDSTLNDSLRALQYCDKRIEFRHLIVKHNHSKKKFLKGWINRDKKLKSIVSTLH
jgi:lysozyme family protein